MTEVGNIEIIRLLINADSKLDVKDIYDYNPLYRCMTSSEDEVAKLLL